MCLASVGGGRVDWVSGPGGGVKRVRLHLVRHGVFQRLRIREHPGSDHIDAKARRVHQGGDTSAPVEDRVGIG